MNIFALALLVTAALIELVQCAKGYRATKKIPRHEAAIFLFIVGFILVYMFQFWIVSPLGSGSVINGS